MLAKSHSIKHYASAQDRFFKPAIVNFFAQHFPHLFGAKVLDHLAEELLRLFYELHPKVEHLQPGQLFWHALHKHTRADSPKRRYVPVVLTLVSPQDVRRLMQGERPSRLAPDIVARLITETFQQGGILSMRDLSLLTLRNDAWVSTIRSAYEREHNVVLPHTGVLHDMGSCITHKKQIVYKVIVQKLDPAFVAQQTNHTQQAVDHYLQDYQRVKTVYQLNPDLDYIHLVTKIAKNVVKEYVELYQQFEEKN